MTDQYPQPQPDPWAQSRRIAEQWKEMGRGVDRPTQVARIKAARLARAKVATEAEETRLRAVVDRAVAAAVAEALKNVPQAAAALAEAAPEVPAAPAVPEKALHEMGPEEWRDYALQYGPHPRQRRRPMTVSELVAGRYEDDGEA
ncbi:hypothetical protein [Actinacidiphila oryziradicis]|uniref:Uncharacterized protein n=1 Tax=Actinacidiphila oryziradicis TaxID=2571141 RepID=A0A4U0SQT5_9ACTN|nr:hypothetical protein [Actinacidiphila oryziradicis]TKA11748.1 hypothetical protein FCI23_10485 [Actinacidiphila oryziradicis]